MFGLDGHALWLVILLVVVLIIWGPGKLPDVGAGLGRALREFKNATHETKDSFTKAISEDPPASPAANAVETKPAETPSDEQKVSR